MRLYDDFARALAGDKENATVLNLLDTSRLDPNTGPEGSSEVDNTYQLIEMRAEELGEAGWRCLKSEMNWYLNARTSTRLR